MGEWERGFDSSVPWRDASLETWGAIEWFGFRSVRSGAVVGVEGWMFATEEFEARPDEADELALELAFIERVAEVLAARGAALVVAVVPTKARACQDKLGRYRVPAPRRYEAFRAALLARGVTAPDLVEALRTEGCETTFLRTDTHWSPRGAAIVARAIGDAVDLPLPPVRFATEPGPAAPYEGDLLRHLPLGRLQSLGPAPDQVVSETTTRVETGAADLRGSSSSPAVTLVGTSNSFEGNWNFSGALKQALQSEVLNVAEGGGSPFAPMLGYLDGAEIDELPPKLVIWEIPELQLTASYELSLPAS